jgi:hypothetical protein
MTKAPSTGEGGVARLGRSVAIEKGMDTLRLGEAKKVPARSSTSRKGCANCSSSRSSSLAGGSSFLHAVAIGWLSGEEGARMGILGYGSGEDWVWWEEEMLTPQGVRVLVPGLMLIPHGRTVFNGRLNRGG